MSVFPLNAIRNYWIGGCLLIVLVGSVAASIWQGQYTIDHVHWGLMLSNALDFANGRVPYKEIFIQYGFLTTFLYATAFSLLGQNLLSLIAVTALAYAIGLYLVFVIANALTNDKVFALVIFLTVVLLHPITIYPWSNYLAFPFLMLGLWGVVRGNADRLVGLLIGLSLGLAILMREGMAPAVILFIFGAAVIDLYGRNCTFKKCLIDNSFVFMGVLAPIILFFLYLSLIDVLSYWVGLSWTLPKVYVETYFPHMGGIGFAKPLITQIVRGVLRFDVRWIIIATMVVANILVLVIFLLKRDRGLINTGMAKVALFSLIFLTSAMHLQEIFRIATGSAVGIVNLFLLLRRVRLHYLAFILFAAAMTITIAPADSGENFSSTNYFFPSKDIIERSAAVSVPEYFKGQRWEADAQQFYENIAQDLKNIARYCPVRYHYNYTYDVFLKVLSPFEQYQLAPFFTEKRMSAVRTDFDLDSKMQNPRDIVIFQQTPNSAVSEFVAPAGFSVYKTYKTPRTNFLYRDNALLILVPTACARLLTR